MSRKGGEKRQEKIYPSRGRRTKLTSKIADALIKQLEDGCTKSEACDLEGVCIGTFHEWIARGEDRDPDRPSTKLYADFANSVKAAIAQGCHNRSKDIEKAGKRDWKALAYLNRVHRPDIYGDLAVQQRGVEEELNSLFANLYWLMPAQSYQDMMNAIATQKRYNLQLDKMEELRAIQTLMQSEYFPQVTSSKIGKAYMDFRKIVKDTIMVSEVGDQNGNGSVMAESK